MLQYKIPQNVGIEDKIVGPFSLRQLIIIAIGGGISYVIFAITSRIYELNILEYILMALPALFALALAMLKIHNVTFGKYILLMLEFAIKPKKRMWDHRGISALVAPDLTDKSAASKKEEMTEEKERKDVNLSDLSAMLDSGGFEHVEQVKHEDIDEVKDDDLITEAYFGHKQKSKTDNMYWRTRDVQKKKLDILAKKPATSVSKEASVSPAPATTGSVPAKPAKNESVTQHLANVIKEARQNNKAEAEAKKEPVKPTEETAQTVTAAPTTPTSTPAPATPTTPSPLAESPTLPIKKKKRRRKRKPKAKAQPIRQDTQVNTTSKSEPVKLIKKPDQTEGETSFGDLSKGGEIEINLE